MSTKKRCAGCNVGRATKRRSLSTRCDSMWAQLVKAGGVCLVNSGARMPYRTVWAPMVDAVPACAGALEAAHVVPRRHRTTRWDPLNGRALCHAHHYFFTNHEKAWRDFIGDEWDRLWVKAQERWNKTFPIAELSRALKEAREAA